MFVSLFVKQTGVKLDKGQGAIISDSVMKTLSSGHRSRVCIMRSLVSPLKSILNAFLNG
jgi:ABC-type uncharacterized transport system YnjBCD ATPase subunit